MSNTNPTERVIELFRDINKTPRRTGNSKPIAQWFINWAKGEGFEVKTDKILNIVITSKASPGCENAPGIVFQGHYDMVCEKTPESKHDFSTDPVPVLEVGDWLRAKDTSLGADNGLGVALAMAIMTDSDVIKPKIELLLTMDEESGLVGANLLKSDFVEGRILLNLDSEEEEVLTVGCAGGADTDIYLPFSSYTAPKGEYCSITVSGLSGGHSGMEIHKGRANANRLLARVLLEIHFSLGAFELASFDGGAAHNAIPRDAEALIRGNKEKVGAIVSEFETIFKGEFSEREANLALSVDSISPPETLFSPVDTLKLIDLLLALPHGVQNFSFDIPGAVETSTNLATVKSSKDGVRILTNQRSSVMSSLNEIHLRNEAVGRLAGAEISGGNNYPAWPANPRSLLLKRCREVFVEVSGKEPQIEATHAGLECGIIGAKYKGMDMISIGPTIEQPHSPDERAYIPSIGRVYTFLAALTHKLSRS